MAKPTIVFDVNETLLDLKVLDPHFQRLFGSADLRRSWFQQVLQSALVMTIIGKQMDFGAVAGVALEMTAQRQGVTLSDAQRTEVLSTIRQLPPHPEVPDAIRRLSEAGYRITSLTNSPHPTAVAQLTNARLIDYFETTLSVDEVGRFKPAREVYDMAVEKLGEAPENLWMVAAHDWDVAGALNAGWHAILVARPGVVISDKLAVPDRIVPDIAHAVDAILNLPTD